jgi:hypothetical protein
MSAQRHPLARLRDGTRTSKKGSSGVEIGERPRASHVLESSNFPLVIELVVEVALDVGVHGNDRGGPHGPL